MAKIKTECAYCGREIETKQKEFYTEPACKDCQKLIDEGREDEIE